MVAALAGCGTPSAGPADAVTAFRAALGGGDGAAACDLLVPTVVDELEADAALPCAQAVLGLDLPSAGDAIPTVRVAGRQALAHAADDVLFLTEDGTTWKITAAGCVPRADRPYDCTIGGS